MVGSREQFFQTNVVGTRTLLVAARAAGVSRFVFVSSPSVAHTGEALAGNGAEPADPRHAKGQYSIRKRWPRSRSPPQTLPVSRRSRCDPHLVWGPGDTQLVGRIVDRAKTGRLGLVSGGRALIDTTYIDNAADALVAAVDHIDAGHGRAFIVSNGQPCTVEEMIERICAAAGVPGPS